jgi:hypothetical protein
MAFLSVFTETACGGSGRHLQSREFIFKVIGQAETDPSASLNHNDNPMVS